MKRYLIIPVLVLTFYSCAYKGSTSAGSIHVTSVVPDTPRKDGYKSLISFKGDTLAYITYNYITNKATYLGRPLKTLFNSLETPIYRYTTGVPYDYYDNSMDAPHIHIYIYPNIKERMNEKKNPAILLLQFNKPILADSIELLRKKTRSNWTDDAINFFENKIVKDIKISQYDF